MGNAKLDQLLTFVSEKRLRESTLGARGDLIASESDKGRVINSGAFRRLQQKAQVFPLEPNASVRTRLTHSIEVSQIGRHIAQKIIQNFGDSQGCYEKLAAFVNTIETACLLHDIGNPPFGHLGESAVKEWFKHNREIDEKPDEPDLEAFDGNPQGFRLMSFLTGADVFGFNLTCTLLLSTVKYPWGVESKPEGKKIGLFSSDIPSYEAACRHLNWTPGRKFPFVRLMDTADNIAYSMSDLEDGLEKRIISEADLKAVFGNESFPNGVLKPFIYFKTHVINQAVTAAAALFESNFEGILAGEDVELIDKNSEVGALIEKVNNFARREIYSHDSAEQVELAGRSVIKGLLNHFGELLKLSEADFLSIARNDGDLIKKKGLDFQARLFRRLPKSYCEKYQFEAKGAERHRRAHLLVDVISGMTDDFALKTYQILEGIRIV